MTFLLADRHSHSVISQTSLLKALQQRTNYIEKSIIKTYIRHESMVKPSKVAIGQTCCFDLRKTWETHLVKTDGGTQQHFYFVVVCLMLLLKFCLFYVSFIRKEVDKIKKSNTHLNRRACKRKMIWLKMNNLSVKSLDFLSSGEVP